MNEALLVLNAGSSSIKFALFQCTQQIAQRPLLAGQIDGIGMAGDKDAPGMPAAQLAATDGAGKTLDKLDLLLAGTPEQQHRAALEFLV